MQSIKSLLKDSVRVFFDVLNRIYFTILFRKHSKHIKSRNLETNSLDGERILVLAPHIDDDMIGCGGAILDYIERGKQVFVLFLTKGNKSGDDQADEKKLIKARREEAYLVAEFIGLPKGNLFFLDADDQNLINFHAVSAFSKVFKQVQPDTLFLPVLLDTHIDHYAATIKFIEYCESSDPILPNTVYLYEVQSPITPGYSNILLDITSKMDKKMRALALYKSQPMTFNFVRAANSVNALASYDHGYSEAYIKTGAQDYYNFFKENFDRTVIEPDLANRLVVHIDYSNSIKSYTSSLKAKQILKKRKTPE